MQLMTLKTIGVILLPLLLPRIIRYFKRPARASVVAAPAYLATLHSPAPSPTFPTAKQQQGRVSQPFRLALFLVALAITLSRVLTPPFNVFLNLSPPVGILQELYAPLRHPLDLRTPTELLTVAWDQSLDEGGTKRSAAEAQLLGRLTSFESRVTYATYGAKPLIECEWCLSPTRKGSSSASSALFGIVYDDHLLYLTPFLAIEYLAALATIGLLVEGMGRRRWQWWGIAIWAMGIFAEGYGRGSFKPIVTGMAEPTVYLLDTYIIIFRNLYFALALTLLYFAPSSTTSGPTSLVEILAPALAPLVSTADQTLQRVRVLNFERTTILAHAPFRQKTTEYWEKYERESLLVNADQETQTTKESLGMLVEAATTVDTTLEAAQVPTGTRISNEVAKWMNMFLVIPASPFPITSAGKST